VKLTRARVGLLLLLIYAALSDARWSYRAARGIAAAGQQDPVSLNDQRFRRLEQALPARGVIGYTSGAQADAFTSEDFRRFLLTEYALAPRLVVNDTAPEWVVGNYPPDSLPAEPPPGWRIVLEGGPGVRLLRRAR
jgi:hypothetical protein